MKKTSALIVLIAAFILGACAHGPGRHCGGCPGGGPGEAQKPSPPSAVIYWCACGPQCTCNAVATKPGKCGCGKELAGGHVVYMEGNTALVCTCGPTCACKIDPNDHTKCGCNKPVQRLNLEGAGLYFCNCAGSCGCNTISDQPGACRCGMPLRQAK